MTEEEPNAARAESDDVDLASVDPDDYVEELLAQADVAEAVREARQALGDGTRPERIEGEALMRVVTDLGGSGHLPPRIRVKLIEATREAVRYLL